MLFLNARHPIDFSSCPIYSNRSESLRKCRFEAMAKKVAHHNTHVALASIDVCLPFIRIQPLVYCIDFFVCVAIVSKKEPVDASNALAHLTANPLTLHNQRIVSQFTLLPNLF